MNYFLIVDDDELICENIISKLKRLSYDKEYQLISANNATDALVLYEKYLPQIIITDIHMHAISGLGLIERINKKEGSPLIFILSGYDDFEYVRKAFLLGVVDYMLKPVDIAELDHKLKTALNKQTNAQVNTEEKHSIDIVDAAIKYIDENLHKNLTMKDVSETMNISYYYFSKLFKQRTNQNFSEYLHKRRIELAKLYMDDPGFSISDIAYKLGYENQNQFSRVFKRHCGEYPTIYRQNKLHQ